jgi:signal transduction histidine kinase
MTPQTAPEETSNLYLLRSLGKLHKPDEWKTGMDDFTHQVRMNLIFDHLVIYKKNGGGNLEPMYARAVGRGRSAEADTAWGDAIGHQAILENKAITSHSAQNVKADRLDRPFGLAIPLSCFNIQFGAVVMIRFGGPVFSEDDIAQAEGYSAVLSLLYGSHRLHQEVETLTLQTRQSNLQDSFISTITHELRSPLGFIKGYATTLLRSDTTWDANMQQEFLQIIDSETDHLQVLIDNMLDSARLQSNMLEMHMQPVRVESLLHTILARTKLHHPGLSIELDVTSPIKLVEADPARLDQVFENLIGNAVKYAPQSPLWITIKTENNDLKITFRDDGPGIPPESLEKIFWRFYRDPNTSKETRGSGLGLYICKQIIDAHKGKISVESIVGKGSIFTILLPALDEK